MAKITGGEVKYGRTMKTGDFENKRVDVALSFTVDDGEDHAPILQAAAKEAHDKAHAMLGIKILAPETAKPLEASKVPEAAPKSKPGPKPKVEPKPEPAKADALGGKDPDTIPPGLSRVHDPLANVELSPEGEDLGFDEDAEASQPEISDAALSTAMNRKVAVLKDKHQGAAPKLIKELINTFVEPPKKSHDIPQKLRGEFLKKLEALK